MVMEGKKADESNKGGGEVEEKKIFAKPRRLTKDKTSQSSLAAAAILKDAADRTGLAESLIVALVVKIQVFFFFFFFCFLFFVFCFLFFVFCMMRVGDFICFQVFFFFFFLVEIFSKETFGDEVEASNLCLFCY